MSGTIFIISAPSGSGKTTLTRELLSTVQGLEFSISYTTRPPRGSEQNGREYFFVGREEFEKMLARDEFLEHADVFGNYYGTAKSYLEDARRRGKDLVLDIDVQGASQLKAKLPDAVGIFILPPSRRDLESRLRRRSEAEQMTDEAVIERRLRTAAREIESYRIYDYILVNDRLEKSVDELKAIVLAERARRAGTPLSPEQRQAEASAERCRQANVRDRLQPILASFDLMTQKAPR